MLALDPVFVRDLQDEAAVAEVDDFGVNRVRAVGDYRSGRGVALRDRNFLDDVFLPPVQADDLDLAVGVGDELSLPRADESVLRRIADVGVNAVAVIKGAELCAGCVGERTLVVLELAVDLEGGAGNKDVLFVLGDLYNLEIAVKDYTDILGLVNQAGIADEERIGLIRSAAAVEVVVQVAFPADEGGIVGIVGQIVSVAASGNVDDSQHIGISDACGEVVVVRVIALELSRIQDHETLAVAHVELCLGDADLVRRCAEIVKTEVLDRLGERAAVVAVPLAHVAAVREVGVAGRSVAFIMELECCGIDQPLNNLVLRVIAVVTGGLLNAVLILVDPQVALDLDWNVHQGNGDLVGDVRALLPIVVIIEAVGIVAERNRREVRIIRNVGNRGVVDHDQFRHRGKLDRGIEDHDEGCDRVLIDGIRQRDKAVGGIIVAVDRVDHRPLGFLRRNSRSRAVRSRIAGDIHGVMLGIHVNPVVGDGEEGIEVEDKLASSLIAVAWLRDDIADDQILEFHIRETVDDTQSPLGPADEIGVVAVGAADNADLVVVEAQRMLVAVAHDSLVQSGRGVGVQRDGPVVREPAVFVGIREVTDMVVAGAAHGVLTLVSGGRAVRDVACSFCKADAVIFVRVHERAAKRVVLREVRLLRRAEVDVVDKALHGQVVARAGRVSK